MFRNVKRRDFLKAAAISSTSLVIGPELARSAGNAIPTKLPKRAYKPGVELSIVGFPGLLLTRVDQANAARIVARAVERGCNYFDVAPAYGKAETHLGPALEPFRKDVFLACKTRARDAAGARKDLDNSLKLLRTDHFDLYQLHVLKDPQKDVDDVLAKGGAMETVLAARKAGIIKYIGFSAHTVESALHALERFEFDSVMFPLNFASIYKGEFGGAILELAKKKNCTRIAIKSMVNQEWPKGADKGKWKHLWYEPLEGNDADMAVRWALTRDITSAIPPGDETCLWKMLDIGANYRATTVDEDARLQKLAQDLNPLFRKGKVTG